jgi:hypothetical protein
VSRADGEPTAATTQKAECGKTGPLDAFAGKARVHLVSQQQHIREDGLRNGIECLQRPRTPYLLMRQRVQGGDNADLALAFQE